MPAKPKAPAPKAPAKAQPMKALEVKCKKSGKQFEVNEAYYERYKQDLELV